MCIGEVETRDEDDGWLGVDRDGVRLEVGMEVKAFHRDSGEYLLATVLTLEDLGYVGGWPIKLEIVGGPVGWFSEKSVVVI
jgi:hypothetical protein